MQFAIACNFSSWLSVKNRMWLVIELIWLKEALICLRESRIIIWELCTVSLGSPLGDWRTYFLTKVNWFVIREIRGREPLRFQLLYGKLSAYLATLLLCYLDKIANLWFENHFTLLFREFGWEIQQLISCSLAIRHIRTLSSGRFSFYFLWF